MSKNWQQQQHDVAATAHKQNSWQSKEHFMFRKDNKCCMLDAEKQIDQFTCRLLLSVNIAGSETLEFGKV